MKYRCKVELAADVLFACQTPLRKTHIMNRGNMNNKQLNSYLDMLIGSDLLSFDCAKDYYSITNKGKQFLRVYKIFRQQLIVSERKQIVVREKKHQLEMMCDGSDVIKDVQHPV